MATQFHCNYFNLTVSYVVFFNDICISFYYVLTMQAKHKYSQFFKTISWYKVKGAIISIFENPRFFLTFILALGIAIISGCFFFSIWQFARLRTLLLLLADTTVLLIPMFWIKRRFWTTLILIWGLALFLLANLLNYRFWSDLLSFESFLLFQNIDSVLIKSIGGLIKPIDIVFFVIPLIYTYIYFRIRKKIPHTRLPLRCSVTLTCISVATFIIAQSFVSLLNNKYSKVYNMPQQPFYNATCERIFGISISRHFYFINNGLTLYTCYYAANEISNLFNNFELTPERTKEIDSFISKNALAVPFDSTFTDNRNKNVVIIIVESLNAFVIDKKINGFEITPTLNSIIRQPGTIYSTSIISQIKDGGSSDGQLIVNTGLLPLRNGIVTDKFIDNKFITLRNSMPDHSGIAVFATKGNIWNEADAFKSYGFEKIYTELDYDKTPQYGKEDGAMFDFLLKKLAVTPQPFFAEGITISMHVPFYTTNLSVPHEIQNSNLSEIEKKYLTTTNYFDSQLKIFLDGLYKISPEDNTIVVITSDHAQGVATGQNLNTKQESNLPIVFIAANTGSTQKISCVSGQYNIFPTLLQILGIEDNTGYRGLGKSLLDLSLDGAVDSFGNKHGNTTQDQIEAYDISNDLIRGNYFAK